MKDGLFPLQATGIRIYIDAVDALSDVVQSEETMDIRTCRLLADYNTQTNAAMNSIIRSLSPAGWKREFQGYFSSIQSLCNHIYICDFNWLKRFSALRTYQYITDPVFENELNFGATVLEEIEEYISKREVFDKNIIQFTSELKQSDMDRILTYTDSHNVIHKRLFGGLVIHFFNHQTHHRGMISIYLENLKIQNDFSNLSDML